MKDKAPTEFPTLETEEKNEGFITSSLRGTEHPEYRLAVFRVGARRRREGGES